MEGPQPCILPLLPRPVQHQEEDRVKKKPSKKAKALRVEGWVMVRREDGQPHSGGVMVFRKRQPMGPFRETLRWVRVCVRGV